MSKPRVLVAGIGNIFLGDDAFGSEVARLLLQRRMPEEVRVVDFGIRGMDLAYALLEGYESVVLLDAAPRGEKPGTLYIIEPDPGGLETMFSKAPPGAEIEPHNMDPMKVLHLAWALGAPIHRVLLVGCEPATTGNEDESPAGLSKPVEAAVKEAVGMVETLVAQLLAHPVEAITK
jgi:hydrogenase maturation protease